jgi:DNA-binding NarL/FixJ family response regulator
MESVSSEGTFGILIVEDERLVALSLALLISQAPGYRVTGRAATLEQALESCKAERPDLALVDLRLAARQNGLDVARALRDCGVACLLLTGNPPAEPLTGLAIGCLAKPFHDDSLIGALGIARARALGSNPLHFRLPPGLQLYE